MIDIDSLCRQYPPELKAFKRGMIAEYLQCRILSVMFSEKNSQGLSFIGGTAIRLLYDSARFSEDLDFDLIGMKKSVFEETGESIKDAMNREGYNCTVDFSFRKAYRCFVRFPGIYYRYGLSSHEEEKLLIQIDAEEQGAGCRPEHKIVNRLGVFVRVNTPPPGVLLSMKIAALLGRKRAKGRDFYDVTFLAPQTAPDFGYLRKKTGIKTPGELAEKLLEKVKTTDMKALSLDVEPFLFSSADTDRVRYFGEFVKNWKINSK